MPPAPIAARISYAPTRVPGRSLTFGRCALYGNKPRRLRPVVAQLAQLRRGFLPRSRQRPLASTEGNLLESSSASFCCAFTSFCAAAELVLRDILRGLFCRFSWIARTRLAVEITSRRCAVDFLEACIILPSEYDRCCRHDEADDGRGKKEATRQRAPILLNGLSPGKPAVLSAMT